MILVASLHFIYVVAYSIVNVMIENIKTKAIFDNKTEVNYMFKRLTDVVQLSIYQNINIIMINIINERVRFFNVCETVFISIDSIIIVISVFVVKRSNYELFLKRFFRHIVYINFINMNNESFKKILHSLNEKKRVSFLIVSVEHVVTK